MEDVTCGNCGLVFSCDAEALPRIPCPTCQSTSRRQFFEGNATLSFTATADLTVIDYPTTLLLEADRLLHQDGQVGLAIVVAHTACEFAPERAFTRAFKDRGVPDLDEPVTDLFNTYNLGNDGVRKV